jgi:hypothetical protein
LLTFSVGLAFAAGESIRVRVRSSDSVLDDQAELLDEYKEIKKLLPPLTGAETGAIRCVGLNYKDHAVTSPLGSLSGALQLTRIG